MRPQLGRLLATGTTVLVLAVGLTACGPDPASPGGKVTISVMGLPAKTEAKSREQFLDRVAEFEKANPGIDIEPSDAKWEARTFATKLAGNRAETVISVPFTEPPALIDKGQVADLGAEAAKLPAFKSYDDRVIDLVRRDGKVYGLPYTSYALGLAYNRQLFAKAGLDPDRPPATWQEVRAASKQIAERTGAIGYAEMTTNNTGGWHLTAITYAFGGSMETKQDSGYVASFSAGPTKNALTLLQQMRWTDQSMGSNQLRNQDDAIRDFAAGKLGMFVSAPDLYKKYTQQYGGDPAVLGMTSLPQAGGSATLLGGSVAMVNAKATGEQTAAAVKWIDFVYLKDKYDPEIAAANAKASAADGLPVGVPGVPVFDAATQQRIDDAIKPHVNIPVQNFRPFVTGTARLEFKAEPPVAGQDLYATLDSVIQGVLTRKDADIDAELAAAQKKVDAVLRKAQ